MFCSKCGTQYEGNFCPNGCNSPYNTTNTTNIIQYRKNESMKTLRMIVGIISIVLFLIISFQSCVVSIGNAFSSSDEMSGTFGMFLAYSMLIAGIIAVAARKTKGGTITAICFYVFGGLTGLMDIGTYSDLAVWSVFSLVFAALLIISLIFDKQKIKY